MQSEEPPSVMANDSSLYVALHEVHRKYSVVHPWLGGFLCILGVITNILFVIVLTRRSMKGNLINCILTVIAVCDAITMLSYFNYLVRVLTFPSCAAKYSFEWIVTLLIHSNLSVVCHTVSIWLTVAMAVVRTYTMKNAVPSAASTKTFSSFTTTLILSISIALVAILFNMPSALSFTIRKIPAKFSRLCYFDVNSTSAAPPALFYYNADLSEFAVKHNGTILKMAFWINGVLFKMAPCFFLTFFIIVLICILTEVRQRRVRLRSGSCDTSHQRSDRTTLMLVVLLSVFLISELPQGLLLIGAGFFDRQYRSKVYNKLGNLMDLLSLINSAANFVVYFIMSQKFRQVFCKTIFSDRLYRMVFRNRAMSLLSAATETNPPSRKASTVPVSAKRNMRPSVCYSQLDGAPL